MHIDSIKHSRVSAGKKLGLKSYDPDWVPKWAEREENYETRPFADNGLALSALYIQHGAVYTLFGES